MKENQILRFLRLRGRSDSRSGNKAELKGLHRQFLHAKSIEVQLPDKTWIEAESEFPKDLREVLLNLNSKIVNSIT